MSKEILECKDCIYWKHAGECTCLASDSYGGQTREDDGCEEGVKKD
jgi:hypothetical protein